VKEKKKDRNGDRRNKWDGEGIQEKGRKEI
jgi:hypothetical protein